MIKEIKELIKLLLEESIRTKLSPQLQIPVEVPTSLEQYRLSHPIGAYLVLYNGSSYEQKDVRNIVAQNRNIEIVVVATVRYRSEYTPEEYVDLAISTLSGYDTGAKRTDRMVYCIKDEWLGEEAGVWSYAATFVVPVEFFPVSL